MKKAIAFLITAIIAVILLIPVSAASVQLGDVDFDSRVTASDARTVLRFAASLETPTAEQFTAADVDMNDKINAADARTVLRTASRLEELPIIEVESEDSSENISNDDKQNSLPAAIRALFDGKYIFIDNDEYEDGETYRNVIAMDKGKMYYEYMSNSYGSESGYGYIIDEQGTVNEWMVPENIAAVIEPEIYADWYDIHILGLFATIYNDQPDYYKTTEYIGGAEHEAYTFTIADETLKFFILDGEIKRIILYDASYYETIHFTIDEFSTDYNSSGIMDLSRFELLSYEDYLNKLYGDSYYPDYTNDSYWTDDLDWDSVEAVEITDKSQLPEEYLLAASDKFYISTFARIPVDDPSPIYGDENYIYSETTLARTPDTFFSADASLEDFAYILKFENAGTDKEKTVPYLIYSGSGIYTEFDAILAAATGIPYEEMTNLTSDETKLIDSDPHTVEVKELVIDGVTHKKITCTYDDYTTNLYFEDGVIIRIEDYYPDGTDAGKTLVYDFYTEFDESELDFEHYEKVGSIEFFSLMMNDMLTW